MAGDSFDAIVELGFANRKGKTVTVRMDRPIFDAELDRWACNTEVVGLAQGAKMRTRGGDPFAAIIMAMERFRFIFNQEKEEYKTVSDWPEKPYFIFPRYIPTSYGTDVHARITAVVEAEIQKVEDEWTRRREESERRRKSEGEAG